nr:putative ribonuclease H-like domain-containing protein [Tanacetum cinerariifolium]
MKIKESLDVTFNETPPPSKTSPLMDDDLDEEEAIKVIKKKNLENDNENDIVSQNKARLVAQGYHQQEGIDYHETYVRNKMHKEFLPPVIEFPLAEEVPTASEESSHYQKKRDATAKRIALLVIEFRDSYEVPASAETTKTTSGGTGKKTGRIVTVTTEDMQKRKNDVKARTTLLLSLPDKHQLRFTKHSKGNEDVNTASASTASTSVPTASANNGDINQIDEDDMEEVYIKWSMAFLCMRADKFWKNTRKKISIQGSDVAGFDKLKSYMENDEEDHALVADEEAPTELALMDNTSPGSKELETLKKEKEGVDGKLAGFLTASKDLDNLIKSQRLDKNKEGLGYSVVAPPPAQIYSSPKKDLPFQRTPAVRSQFRAPWVPTANRNFPPVSRKFSTISRNFPIVNRKFPTANGKFSTGATKFSTPDMGKKGKVGSSQININDKGYWDSGCSRHMTCNISYLSDYEPIDRGYVSFGQGGWKITGKGTIKTGKLEFENVYFVKDLKYNLFSVSQICDNKNSFLFTDSECIVLGRDFKLLDNATILLRTPRQHNMYSIDLNNIVPHKDLTYLVAKASADECMLWHRRLGHLNFKIMNKLVRHNLVRGLPTKCFENDHTCTACLKGKQHKASYKSKLVNSVSKPLHTFHMDLFGPTSDETSGILRKFITEIENLKDLKVKIIRVLVNKSQNKTLYELFNGRTPAIGFLKPFGCLVMSLNTLDNLGKFEAKGDEENKAIEKGAGPNWLFNIDSLTKSVNYVLLDTERDQREFNNARTPQQNGVAERRNRTLIEAARTMLADAKLLGSLRKKGMKVTLLDTQCLAKHLGQEVKTNVSSLRYIALPNWANDALLQSSLSKPQDNCSTEVPESSGNPNPTASTSNSPADQMETLTVESPIPTVSSPVPTAYYTNSQEPSSDARLISKRVANQVETPSLENIFTLTNQFEDILRVTTNLDESNGVEADVSNMETTITASPTPTLRIHKDHPKSQIIGPVDTPIQTRNKSKETLVDCPKWVRSIGTKWVLKNKKDERGIVIRYKARLVAQGHTQEEGIDYDEVFTPVARIEAIRLFLAYASFMGFTVYQMDVKSAFLYGTIDEEVYVIQPPGFQDPKFLAKVYKVKKAMYGLHQAPRAWQRGDFILVQVYVDDIIFESSNPQLCREFKALMHEKFQMSAMGELNLFLGLQVLQKEDGIFLSQDKYIGDILKKFRYSDVRSSNTPMDKENPWGKDRTGKDVDLHLYRSMIGSLMYLTASRPDIMFAVCAYARHQVTPK